MSSTVCHRFRRSSAFLTISRPNSCGRFSIRPALIPDSPNSPEPTVKWYRQNPHDWFRINYIDPNTGFHAGRHQDEDHSDLGQAHFQYSAANTEDRWGSHSNTRLPLCSSGKSSKSSLRMFLRPTSTRTKNHDSPKTRRSVTREFLRAIPSGQGERPRWRRRELPTQRGTRFSSGSPGGPLATVVTTMDWDRSRRRRPRSRFRGP